MPESKPDVRLSNGRVIRCVREPAGNWFAYPLDNPRGEMTHAEWSEYADSVVAALRSPVESDGRNAAWVCDEPPEFDVAGGL